MDKRFYLGWALIFIGLTPIVTFVSTPLLAANHFFWFSNHTFIIIGFALLFANPFWVFAEFCIGVIPELVWSIDFIFQLIAHKPFLGITDYMFTGTDFNWIQLYSIQHILFIPCTLYALHILGGPVRNAWIGSLVHQLFLAISGYLNSYDLNINCAYHTCAIAIPWHMITWPILMIVHLIAVYNLTWWGWKKIKES